MILSIYMVQDTISIIFCSWVWRSKYLFTIVKILEVAVPKITSYEYDNKTNRMGF